MRSLSLTGTYEDDSPTASITTIISALQRGVAFRQLVEVTLRQVWIGDVVGMGLVETLAGAACAPFIENLWLPSCDIGSGTAAAFGTHFGQDVFPALRTLNLGGNPLGGHGIIALLAGMRTAPRMRLENLLLFDFGIG